VRRRVAAVIGLPAENAAEYDMLHAAIWPEITERLAASGIRNYSIYRHGDVLFSYFEYEGDDYEADQAALAADPATQRWWALTAPLQRPLGPHPEQEWWMPLPEVFHLD
jgi:L-rhamnose mutarotase